ncbi:MAG: hypothetical protein AB7V27_19160 [Candidatus Binatia bacterium]
MLGRGRALLLMLTVSLGIAAGGWPRGAFAQAGCCVCTACTGSALFACRDALDTGQCETTCQGLGCTGHQFTSGTECANLAQCYGDCCDAPNAGCSQAPQASCTGGSIFFAGSLCDGSSCVLPPPTATITLTPIATQTPTSSQTPTATRSSTPTDTASATLTHTLSPTPIPTATVSPTVTRPPSPTPSASPTPTGPPFTWLLDAEFTLTNLHTVPHNGLTFVYPFQRRRHSLDLQDAANRFCTESGLFPVVRLDLDPDDCENACLLGVFPQDTKAAIHIARLPALHRRAGGTFDVLIDTVIGCQMGMPPTRLRMPAAVTYARCHGDCDGNDVVGIDELTRAVLIALGQRPATECLANDQNGDGALQIHELIGAVDAALRGCTNT